jgi:F-type H+-transporting ATPase subunit gamma
MASVKELRLRITSVGNIQQITRAMEMVATTKLRRFQDRAIASRPYTEEISGLVSHLASVLGEDVEGNPLFRRGAGTKTAVLLVSSDRGLCGAYNSNLFASVNTWMADRDPAEVDFFVYGKKGYSYLKRSGYQIERLIVDPPLESVDFGSAARTAQTLVDAFSTGDYADVFVYYSAFESMARYKPTTFQLLPLEAGDAEAQEGGGDLILEPDAETIFESLIPRYLEVRVYNALLEALTSEYASRRMSMKNATEAASDMITMLKGRYNRVRQENITKDLLDIVGGAEALR